MSEAVSTEPLSDLRLALHRNGYRPVPVAGVHLAMKSAGKRPLMKGWETICAAADEAEIARWTAAQPNCTNTGLLCGEIVGVDIDVPVEALACPRCRRAASDRCSFDLDVVKAKCPPRGGAAGPFRFGGL